MPARHGDAVLRQQLLRLILVDIHALLPLLDLTAFNWLAAARPR
jgi:hypothetical protein